MWCARVSFCLFASFLVQPPFASLLAVGVGSKGARLFKSIVHPFCSFLFIFRESGLSGLLQSLDCGVGNIPLCAVSGNPCCLLFGPSLFKSCAVGVGSIP